MKLIKKSQGKLSQAKRHFGQLSVTKIKPEEGTQRLSVSCSHFLPQGGAEMYPSSIERAYYCISGSLMVRGKEGEQYLLEPGDLLYIGPGEDRSIEVVGNEPATALVIKVDLA